LPLELHEPGPLQAVQDDQHRHPGSAGRWRQGAGGATAGRSGRAPRRGCLRPRRRRPAPSRSCVPRAARRGTGRSQSRRARQGRSRRRRTGHRGAERSVPRRGAPGRRRTGRLAGRAGATTAAAAWPIVDGRARRGRRALPPATRVPRSSPLRSLDQYRGWVAGRSRASAGACAQGAHQRNELRWRNRVTEGRTRDLRVRNLIRWLASCELPEPEAGQPAGLRCPRCPLLTARALVVPVCHGPSTDRGGRSRPVAEPAALRSSATRDRSAGRARQGRFKSGHTSSYAYEHKTSPQDPAGAVTRSAIPNRLKPCGRRPLLCAERNSLLSVFRVR
jgi:hypothetical protein